MTGKRNNEEGSVADQCEAIADIINFHRQLRDP